MKNRSSCLVTVAATFLLGPSLAVADFTQTMQVNLTTGGNHMGLAFDGANWHIADPFSDIFKNYDADFNFIDSSTVTGVSDMRGLTYDSNSGNLFVSDNDSGIVREVTVGGSEIQQFIGGFSGGLNGLAYNSGDDSIWLAYFNGTIENRTRTGELIDSFTGKGEWTGVAYDDFNDTLLLLETEDTLFEYQTDGTLIGEIITTDMIPNNGLGLAYDSSIGRLYVTSQTPGVVTIFDDPSRIPEPSGLGLLGLWIGTVAMRRHRIRMDRRDGYR